MIRKIGMAASAAVLVLGGVAVVAAPAFAGGKTPLGNAHGTVHCSITAKVKINPPLTNANTLPSTTTSKVKTVSCSSSGGTILGAIAKGKGSVSSVGTDAGHVHGPADAGNDAVHVDDQLEGQRRHAEPEQHHVRERRSVGCRLQPSGHRCCGCCDLGDHRLVQWREGVGTRDPVGCSGPRLVRPGPAAEEQARQGHQEAHDLVGHARHLPVS